MATGKLTLGPLAAAVASSSARLSGASEPGPTSAANWLGAGSAAGARAAGALALSPTTRAGARAPVHDGQWFDRIHVVPREVALGNVVSDRVLSVEVWNAFRTGFRLWSVDIAGPAGVDVSAGSLPHEYPTLHSEIHSVYVWAAGVDPIANTLTWTFRTRTSSVTYVAVTTPGSDLTLSGTRLTLFAVPPDGIAAQRERYGYLSDVITSRQRTEQRVQLRAIPGRELRFHPLVVTDADALELMSKLYAHGGGVYALPFWPDASELTAPVAPGATAVYADTTTRAFAPGGTAILWTSQRACEPFVIDQVFADHLTVAGTISGAYAAPRAIVAPLLAARLTEAPQLSRPGGPVAETDVAFSQEAV